MESCNQPLHYKWFLVRFVEACWLYYKSLPIKAHIAMFLKALPESFQKNSEKTLKSRSCFNFFVMNLDGLHNISIIVCFLTQMLLSTQSSEAYLQPSQTSKMEFLEKVVCGFYPSTISVKSTILDVWLGSECASEMENCWWYYDVNTIIMIFNIKTIH